MRRVFPLLLLTPLLVSCSESATPVATPPHAMHSEGAVPTEGGAATEADWPAEENWFTPGGAIALVEEEAVLQTADASQAALQGADAPKEAVMVLGNPEAGTSFYPIGAHDQSFHARDRMIPGSVTINAGETVTFKMFIGHRLSIYDDGTMPDDIQRTPGPLLLYPVNRLFLQPLPAPQYTLRFMRPGKYLVVCAINTHFFDANMWGWVHVK